MLKFLRIGFIIFLMLCFIVACRHRKQETTAVLKTASQPASKKGRQGATPSSKSGGGMEQRLGRQLGLSARQMRNSRLYSFVLDWYGTPYRYGGCKKSGVDCSCFAGMLCEKVYGYSLPRSTGDIFKSCRQLSLKDAREGDLVFFKIGGRNISHVGVYLRNRLFVHASTSSGVMVNSLDEAYYKKYFFSAGRMKEA